MITLCGPTLKFDEPLEAVAEMGIGSPTWTAVERSNVGVGERKTSTSKGAVRAV